MKHDCCPSSLLRAVLAMLICVASAFAAPQTTPPSQPQATPTPKPSPSPATAKDLIAQGIQQYRKDKYDLAAKQFLAALKLEPNNDEALGYASLTAYQLGNHLQARELFQRRADLPDQKSSVQIFSQYMVALTWWRQAHETIAKFGALKLPQTEYTLPEKELTTAQQSISSGLASLTKVLTMKADYAEAINLQNLLHAEAALLANDERRAETERKASLSALRQAIKLYKGSLADFGAPTFLVGEFAQSDEEQNQIKDPMLSLLEGGKPLTRATAVLPVFKINPAKPKGTGDQPPPSGVGPGGSAVSVGPGQGALRPSKAETMQVKGGLAKVEVLIAPSGKVVFTRMLDGPPVTTGPALEAAKKWTFSPAKFEGHPIQVLGVITFDVQPSKDSKTKGKSAPDSKATGGEKKKN